MTTKPNKDGDTPATSLTVLVAFVLWVILLFYGLTFWAGVVYFIVAFVVCGLISVWEQSAAKKTPVIPIPAPGNPIYIETSLISAGGSKRKAKLILTHDTLWVTSRPESDNDPVTTQKRAKAAGIHIGLLSGIDAQIPIGSLNGLLFEDRSKNGNSMAGFGVSYQDAEGQAMCHFWNDGPGSVKRTRGLVNLISNTHKALTRGLNLPELEVIDVGKIANNLAHDAVHR